MDIVFTLLILAVFAAGIFALALFQKKHISYSKRVFIGLAFGVIFGAILQFSLGLESKAIKSAIDYINIVGDGYVSLLQMLVIPLVFVSIVHAFIRLKVSSQLGKIARNVLIVLLSTTSLSAVVGYASVLLFQLNGANFTEGAAEKARIAQILEKQATIEGNSITSYLTDLIPHNIFADFAGSRPTSTIAVVIFAIFVGVAFLGVKRKSPEEALTFENIVKAIYKITLRITTLVLRLTPFGIFALMTNVLATSNFSSLLNLGKFVLASYVALALVFIVHLLILARYKISPITYLKKAWAPLSLAFTSRSSAGVLPLNIETQKNAFGVDDSTANFSASFALSIGQNGCAGVYPAMLATIVAPSVGVNVFSLQFILSLVAIVTISSFGVAGIGGGATFASLIVLGSLNLPITIVGLLISVEPFIDMARTLVNVSDAMTAGIVTSKSIGTLDEAILNKNEGFEEANA